MIKAESASISVIIPTFNAERFIAETLHSVYQQSQKPSEVILVDDGSKDQTLTIVKEQFKEVEVVEQDHTGMPTAGRNTGLKLASSDFITFLDQDDIWPPGTLERHVKVFQEYPEVQLSKGMVSAFVDDIGQRQTPTNQFLLSSLMLRSSVFKEVGRFDETMRFYGTDLEWIYRFREQGLPLYIHTDISLFYRLHDLNHSNDRALSLQARKELMLRLMHRKIQAQKDQKPFHTHFNFVANSQNLSL